MGPKRIPWENGEKTAAGAVLNVEKHKFHLNFTAAKPEGATFWTANHL